MDTKTAGAAIIQIPNTLTETIVSDFSERVRKTLEENPSSLTLDCSLLNNVISRHIWCLWETYLACQKNNVELKLESPTYGLTRILRVLDLYDFFAQKITGCDTWTKAVAKSFFPGKPGTYIDEFMPQSKIIEEAIDRFMGFLESAQVSMIQAFDLRTIFYEVVNNIMTHSSMETSESIVFTAELSESKITMVFIDSGDSFDPTQIPDDYNPESVLKSKQTRGYGLTMLRRLSDSMKYIRKEGILNILVIEKSWR